MNSLLHLLRNHWRLVVLVLIVLLILPAVVAAVIAAAEEEAVITAPDAQVAPEVETVIAPAEAPGAPAVEPSGADQSFAEYQDMIERPLFSSTRRPPVLRDAPQDNLDAQQLREVWRLSGIAMQQGRQLASFSARQGEQRLLLEQGMVLADEWRLEHIGSDHVLFGNGVSEVRMPLREPVVAKDPADPATAAAQKKKKNQKQQQKSPKPAEPAAPTDKTSPPADTPAAAAPAQ